MADGRRRMPDASIRHQPYAISYPPSAMTRINVLIAIVLAAAVGRTAPGDAVAPAALGDLFKPGGALQDRNGDGAFDFVDARIVLADEPTAGELAAAADVAARLGYETSAMNLPVPRGASADDAAFSIYIGAKALAQAGASADAIGVGALKAGDGAVASFVSGGRRGVALLGGDEAGLESAAVMLGGHLPYVGDQKSATTDKIADEVRQFLTGKGVDVSSTTVPVVHVRANVDGVERVVAVVQLA